MDPSLSSIPIDPLPPIVPPPAVPVVSSAAANPTASTGGLPTTFSHPPYSEMICEAIGALKERNGSSKRAIAKYIESAHKDLPPTHSALLTHHLKRLKGNGILVMVKKSYKLASAARSEAALPDSSPPNPSEAPAGPKRGRGRPPKPKPAPALALPTAADPNSQQIVPLADGPKKSPGRPRKNGPAVQLGPRRGRGRPPKTGPKKSPGRPRKPKTVRSVVGANAVKRGRGRPPKALTQLPQQVVLPVPVQPVAVPYADTAAAAVVAPPNIPKPRGRPKGAAGAAGAVVSGKRRGRPPKIGGVAANPLKPKKTTGKPVGRPRKTTEGADTKALAAAYMDVKRKLEYFQLKVKQAVGVLKPQFSSESNISAIGAIQELEGLAAMDVSTPYREEAQPPPPPPPTQPPQVTQNEGLVH